MNKFILKQPSGLTNRYGFSIIREAVKLPLSEGGALGKYPLAPEFDWLSCECPLVLFH
jgi:hypothetical protein